MDSGAAVPTLSRGVSVIWAAKLRTCAAGSVDCAAGLPADGSSARSSLYSNKLERRAASRADWIAGNNSEITNPMIAITTSNSTSVNARRWRCDMALLPK
jgi:hypothetical protein